MEGGRDAGHRRRHDDRGGRAARARLDAHLDRTVRHRGSGRPRRPAARPARRPPRRPGRPHATPHPGHGGPRHRTGRQGRRALGARGRSVAAVRLRRRPDPRRRTGHRRVRPGLRPRRDSRRTRAPARPRRPRRRTGRRGPARGIGYQGDGRIGTAALRRGGGRGFRGPAGMVPSHRRSPPRVERRGRARAARRPRHGRGGERRRPRGRRIPDAQTVAVSGEPGIRGSRVGRAAARRARCEGTCGSAAGRPRPPPGPARGRPTRSSRLGEFVRSRPGQGSRGRSG
ncbi:hypothetical protein CJ468_04266 [Nocardia farcinica]|nr:hypothetical protein CJ468_04266 [Nocardia farcinica]